MNTSRLGGLAAGLVLAAIASQAGAQHAPATPAPPASANLQGDQQAWINDPHMHDFYATTVAAFANGPAKVDVGGFERTSFAIFRDFGKSMGMDPMHMQDHLKLIPRQVVQIVREDPHVLDSYQNFVDATFGPQ